MAECKVLYRDGKIFHSVDGSLIRCVACNKPIEYTEHYTANHHCSETTERAKRSANTRLEKHETTERSLTWGRRLAIGFGLMSRGGDWARQANEFENVGEQQW